MSTVLQSVKNKALAYFKLDDASPFDDYSGYGRTATGTGTTNSIGLANGFNYSTVFSRSKTGSFDCPVFKQGQEKQSFTIEAWILPIVSVEAGYSTEGQTRILSHSAEYDGLALNGRTLTFSTKYSDNSSATASYVLPQYKRVHVAGVHTADKNLLYVDGVLVAQADISDAQKLLSYIATDGKLYSGADATTAQRFAANGYAFYGKALNATEIWNNYSEGARNVDLPHAGFAGQPVYLGASAADVFLTETFTTAFDWSRGQRDGVTPDYDNLQYLAAPGTWVASIPLNSGTSSIFGVVATWEGVNVTVEFSTDATTWTAATNGVRTSVIPNGFNATNAILFVRVTLTTGGYIDELRINGFRTGNYANLQKRTVSVTAAASPGIEKEPIELSQFWGVSLAGGTLTIGTDSSAEAYVPKTVEVWVKNNSATAISYSTNLSGASSTYLNGVSGLSAPQGEWSVCHFVTPAGISGAITIAGDVQVGRVVLYEQALSAAQVKGLYDSYLGVITVRLSDGGSISITEPTDAAEIYSYDWAITAGG